MIRAIALDDEPPALRVLTHFCGQVDFIDLQKTFTRADEARQHLAQFPTDLLFLDINMPAISGLDFYRATANATTGEGQSRPLLVIFTTAYAEFAVEGFTLNAVDYLLKPFTFDRFQQAVDKARDLYQWQQPSTPVGEVYLHIRADYALHQVLLTDILYVEGLDDYLKIHLHSQSHPIVARMTMKNMQERLPDTEFVRVHRSFIVPLPRIEAVRNKMIFVAGREIPIGASYETEFLRRFGGRGAGG